MRFYGHPRYEVFYEVQPLLNWLNQLGPPADLTIGVLTRAIIVALKVTTLMRSGGLHNLVSNVHTYSGNYFVLVKDKRNHLTVARIDGVTRDLVLDYIFRRRHYPATRMFRNQNNPLLCNSSERIAKHYLIAMEAVGINTIIFKAHSIRGAVTTFLLSSGVDRSLVQAHGQWSSAECMNRYYSCLHNHIPWDQVLHTRTIPGLPDVVDQRGQQLDQACPLGECLTPTLPGSPSRGRSPTAAARATRHKRPTKRSCPPFGYARTCLIHRRAPGVSTTSSARPGTGVQYI
mmetsp:Transcript_10044/g.17756  ORF Transcript_10044/g.17756 Transcript_10044/m.17756 type:complete len:288 (+) Transcript_10044:295-1158(+)